jgi:hypothetical protein
VIRGAISRMLSGLVGISTVFARREDDPYEAGFH